MPLTLSNLLNTDLKRFETKEIELYEKGNMKYLTREYFTKAGVEKDVRQQSRSQNWHQDGQAMARADRDVKSATVGRMIMVNKAEVTRMVASDDVGPGRFKITEEEDGTTMMVHASLKEQMRNIEQLVPLHTANDVSLWALDRNQKKKDMELYKVKYQEEQDDLWCDRRMCMLCGYEGQKAFKSKEEEQEHRTSEEPS